MAGEADDGGVCTSCPPRLALSVEEERILGRMRELRQEYRSLRASDHADPAELERLRPRFRACQEELRRANRDKLIRLGHEP